MNKWHMVIDVENCEDCNNCFLSCKDEHVDNTFPGYTVAQPRHGHRWINIMRRERGQYPLIDVAYLPIPCQHCDNAPCMEKAKHGAVRKRPDGIVLIDPVRARGQKELVKACPYGAVYWNEEANVPQKCTFCAHLLDDGWNKTRCAQVCPSLSLVVVNATDEVMAEKVKAENLEVLHPEYGTKPRVYYKNLYRYTRCFIAGSVTVTLDGKEECAAGALVKLRKEESEIKKVKADAFGDFKFDRLDKNSGTYRLDILYQDKSETVEVKLGESMNVGVIELKER